MTPTKSNCRALAQSTVKTGKLVPGFGSEGAVNLRAGVADKFPVAAYHMASPGVIYRNLIITGAQGKEDDPAWPDEIR